MKRGTFKVFGLLGLALGLYGLLVFYGQGYRLDWSQGIAHVPIVRPGMVEKGGLRLTVGGVTREAEVVQGQVTLQQVTLRLGEQRQQSTTIPLGVVFWGADLPSLSEQAIGEPVKVCEMAEPVMVTSIAFEPPEGATHFAVTSGPTLVTGKLPLPR